MPISFARALCATVLAATAACGTAFVPDTAIMPLTGGGTPVLSDQGAIQTASYALGERSRTAGQPGEAARALASIDYLAGALYTNPHWSGIPATTKLRMLQGRAEVRSYLAVAPGTPSQAVVNGLIRAADALEAGDTATASAALPASVFTRGPAGTIALLSNLPYLQQANVAAQNANADITVNCQFTQNCG